MIFNCEKGGGWAVLAYREEVKRCPVRPPYIPVVLTANQSRAYQSGL